jgi:hypothetical protein
MSIPLVDQPTQENTCNSNRPLALIEQPSQIITTARLLMAS